LLVLSPPRVGCVSCKFWVAGCWREHNRRSAEAEATAGVRSSCSLADLDPRPLAPASLQAPSVRFIGVVLVFSGEVVLEVVAAILTSWSVIAPRARSRSQGKEHRE
jgi:hypothetical protein